VAYSRLDGDTIAFGDPTTTQQTLDLAIQRFDAALAHPAVSEEVAGLATVGKARALVDRDLGTDVADAAALVADIPTDFQFVTEHAPSPQRLRNAIFQYGQDFLWSMSDAEGGTGLAYLSAEDPRVPFTDTEDVGLDGTTPQFTLDKYPDAASSVVVADGIEARLIEAEAQLRQDDFAGMRTTLNDLRDFFGLELDPLPTPGDRDEAIDQLFSERAFWLFATGHRLGDMRRLIRQYQRPADEVFPTGTYLKGGDYGADVNFPIPRSEDSSNPKSNGCLNRDA
jgi:hypothetical protein